MAADGGITFIVFDKIPPSADATIITVVLCLCLAWPAVILRFYTRTRVIEALGSDDWFVMASLICFTAFSGCTIRVFSITGSAKSLTLQETKDALNLLTSTECLYIWAMILLKISLGIFFLRITTYKWQRIAVYCSVIAAVIVGLAYFFFAIFQCGTPVTALSQFYRRLQNQCVTDGQILAIGYFHAAVSTATDLLFCLIPIPMIYKSSLGKRNKLTVYFILSLGTLGGIASAVRIAFVHYLTITDPSFFVSYEKIYITSTIEPALGITASSLATLRKLFGLFKEHMTSYRRSKSLGYSSTMNFSGTGPYTATIGSSSNQKRGSHGAASSQYTYEMRSPPAPLYGKERGEQWPLETTDEEVEAGKYTWLAAPSATSTYQGWTRDLKM